MCYDDNARPPEPPGEKGMAHGTDLVLTAADGNRFAAYVADPDKQTDSQVVIYPDIRGLHQFYKELALRFAEAGIRAISLDYFGRTADLTARDDSFEFMPHVQQLRIPTIFQDVNAALTYLRTNNSEAGAIFPIGFCLGGSLSLISATNPDFNFAGAIAFYSGLTRDFGGYGTALDHATEVKYPVLGLFGGADQSIPVDQIHELEQHLQTTGVENKIIIYPGAPHSFFDRRSTDFANASADAWKQVLEFIHSHSKHAVNR
ncbi:carboxymethylenebutenolidase [Ktedonobacteria bacterium brp13]|nr:carboxymethylenebutenolidase [Ktedonobacteria bacterium brp13]